MPEIGCIRSVENRVEADRPKRQTRVNQNLGERSPMVEINFLVTWLRWHIFSVNTIASSKTITNLKFPLLCSAATLLAACTTLSTQDTSRAPQVAYQPPPQIEVPPPQVSESKSELVIPDQPSIDLWVRRFSRDKHKSFQAQLDRARYYAVPCQEIFAQQGLPKELIFVALVESGFSPTAQSHANAVGMWQFISSTGKRFNLEQNRWIDERRHPLKAARAAADYLSFLFDTFGSWPLALAGYNAGEKAVQAALDQSGLHTFWELADHGYLPAETRDYVPKVYAAIKISRDPKHYGFHFDPQHYTPKHETVSVPGGVKLGWLGKKIGVSEASLQSCNPELCQPVTPPGQSSYELCVPIGTKQCVVDVLSSCPIPEEPPTITQPVQNTRANIANKKTPPPTTPAMGSYTVQKGDTWYSLGRRFGCSPDTLASLNGVKPSSQALKTGESLKVPQQNTSTAAAPQKTTNTGSAKSAAAPAKDDNPPLVKQSAAVQARGNTQAPPVKEKSPAGPAKGGSSTPVKQSAATTAKAVSTKEASLAASSKQSSAASCITQKPCTSYPVRQGDTLWSIAERFHVSVDELCAQNKIKLNQKLVAGNSLTVCTPDAGLAKVSAKKKN